jgi:hypothetical protein
MGQSGTNTNYMDQIPNDLPLVVFELILAQERLEDGLGNKVECVCAKHRTRLILLKELVPREEILVICVSLDVALSPVQTKIWGIREID